MKARAGILCGPGNNGGDGFVVARLLRELGWEIEVFLYGEAGALPADAAANLAVWSEMGAVAPLVPGALEDAVARAEEAALWEFDEALGEEVRRGPVTLYVDALFGTGLSRGFDGALAEIVGEWGALCYEHGVAVDLPSGICADSGRALGGGFPFCKLVVTFEAPKRGHYLGGWQHDVERLVVVPLDLPEGWPDAVYAQAPSLVERDGLRLDARGLFGDGLQKSMQGHKFSHGHALVLSGPPGKGGAARLAARAALRVGAGLVSLGCSMRAVFEHSVHLNAIMVQGLDGTHGLDEFLEDDRVNALCLGPGMGLAATTGDLVKRAVAAKRATVLDADALLRFQRHPEALFGMLHESCVLTPHGGEFARLFPDLAQALDQGEMSKIEAAQAAAQRAGCVVLFKGADTVIAGPEGQGSLHAALYDQAAPWRATAGAGDVLAGIITGLLARGFAPMEAAETGAWLHAAAARRFGPGLIAEDLPEALPQVFRDLGL
jgi:hydroxyethylthiazole kinase-like uncharacterized protein yjeF